MSRTYTPHNLKKHSRQLAASAKENQHKDRVRSRERVKAFSGRSLEPKRSREGVDEASPLKVVLKRPNRVTVISGACSKDPRVAIQLHHISCHRADRSVDPSPVQKCSVPLVIAPSASYIR
jgi:hypothetical protein